MTPTMKALHSAARLEWCCECSREGAALDELAAVLTVLSIPEYATADAVDDLLALVTDPNEIGPADVGGEGSDARAHRATDAEWRETVRLALAFTSEARLVEVAADLDISTTSAATFRSRCRDLAAGMRP